MNNILDLLIEYSKLEKKIDFDYVKKVVDIAIKEKDLEDYIAEVKFHENLSTVYENNCGGLYSMNTAKITISQHMIDEYYRQIKKSSAKRLSAYDEFLTSGAVTTQVILHEVEHANQLKKIYHGNNFESLLLKAAYSFCLNVNNSSLDIYELEFFDYMELKELYGPKMPHERLADIYSMHEIVDMLEPIYDYIHPQIEKFVKTRLHKFYIKGYDNRNLNPTESYLSEYVALNIPGTDNYFNDEFYDALALEKESDLENRLLFGLEITKSEYDKCKVNKKRK